MILCAGCKFWKKEKPTAEYGYCRRHAQQLSHWTDPQNGEVIHNSAWEWPAHKPDDWCGDAEPRETLRERAKPSPCDTYATCAVAKECDAWIEGDGQKPDYPHP